MNNEQCLKALEFLENKCTAWGKCEQDEFIEVKKIFKELIHEHFDEKGNVKTIANIFINGDEMKQLVDKAVDEFFDPEPYKFEDLKPDMWLWDNVEKKCNKIIDINENDEIGFYYITESVSRYIVKFEENRFYPVTKAICEVNER